MNHRKSHDGDRGRRRSGSTDSDILYGAHAVLAALANPRREKLRLWASDNALQRHGDAIAASGITIEKAAQRQFAGLVGPDAVHQGLVLETRPLPDMEIEDLPRRGPVMVLDQVTDPHNVGAILRSCAAFSADALIVTARGAPSLTGTVAKAASGAVEHVTMIRVTNLARALEDLADCSYQRIGLDGAADTTLDAVPLLPPVALVLGAEGKGLRELTRRHCDHLARLATTGPIASLNVSNAAVLALHIVGRRLAAPGS